MRLKTIEKLCCPFEKSDLQIDIFVKDIEMNVLEGILSCPTCKRKYPIVHGVPIMVPDEYRQEELEKPFMDNRKIQHNPEDISPIQKTIKEVN